MIKFLFIVFLFVSFNCLANNKINNVVITGNTIYNELVYKDYINIKDGDVFNNNLKNNIIKDLFSTDYVDDVEVSFKNNNLYIKIKEKKFVSKITFTGNKKLKDSIIKDNLELKVKEPFSEQKLQQDINFIDTFYRSMGIINVGIETKIENVDSNLVNIFFDIKENKKNKIENIYFIGNNTFSSRTLKGELYSREKKFYRFGRRINYNSDILQYDSYLLRMFYLSKGYIDFTINSINGVLNKNNNFDIVIDINEGNRYTFGIVSVQDNIGILDENLDFIINKYIKNNTIFNINTVNKIESEIIKFLSNNQFFIINQRIVPDKENNKVNVLYSIDKAKKKYIGEIKIKNNFRTSDSVIRQQILLFEGDSYDDKKLERSIQRIRNLGFFKNVTYKKIDGVLNNRVDIIIDVEEQSTGNLSFGVGYNSSYGLNGNISIRQRNLFGDGIGFDLGLNLNEHYKYYSLGFSKPNFLGTEITSGLRLFYQDMNNINNPNSNLGYNRLERGLNSFLSFNVTEYLSTNLSYSFTFDDVSDVLPDYKYILSDRNEEISEFGIGFSYDKRDSFYRTTSGYMFSYDFSFAGLLGTKDYIKHVIYAAYYQPLYLDKLILKIEGKAGFMYSINNNPLYPNDGFYLGGYNMRGFESGGLGPRVKNIGGTLIDGYGLAGTRMYYFNTELKFPLFLPKEFSVYGIFFFNAGTVTGIESNSNVRKDLILDSGSIRSAAGFSILWETVVGNLSFDFSKVIQKEEYDVEENFRFNIGTNF